MLTHCLRFNWLCLFILATPHSLYAAESGLNIELIISKHLGLQVNRVRAEKMSGLSAIVASQVIKSKVACLTELGRCSIVAQINSPQGYIMTLINWYEVYVLKQSPVLNEPVEEGEAYNPSKVVFKKQFVKLGTWPSKRKLVSSEFLKDFKPGDAISSYMLRDRLIVVAGDVVTVSYLNKHISIEAEAIALSSGSLGSEINIVRSSGEEAFRAIVVGPKKLEVKI